MHLQVKFPRLLNCHSNFEFKFHARRRVDASNLSEPTSRPSMSPSSISLLPSVAPSYAPSVDLSSDNDYKWYSVTSLILLHGEKFSTPKDIIRDAVLYSADFSISDFLNYVEKKSVSVFIKHSPDHMENNVNTNNISAASIAYMMQSWTNDKIVAIKVPCTVYCMQYELNVYV